MNFDKNFEIQNSNGEKNRSFINFPHSNPLKKALPDLANLNKILNKDKPIQK